MGRFGKMIACCMALMMSMYTVIGSSAINCPAAQAGMEGRWAAVPFVTDGILRGGNSGGEGGQWPHMVEASAQGGGLLLFGTNTGGIYRSGDGGRSWSQANRGFSARGCNAAAIDPRQPQCILAAGISDEADSANGLYLSEDGGNNWAMVLSLPVCGNKYYKKGLCFDPSSYSQSTGRCMTAYYSTPYEDDEATGLNGSNRGLYRSVDGGRSWSLIMDWMSDARIRVDSKGTVYAARNNAVYKSQDKGVTFDRCYSGNVTGFDCTPDGTLQYVCSESGLLVSRDGGEFTEVECGGFPSGGRNVSVNPYNGNNLLIESVGRYNDIPGRHAVYSSMNGGKSWSRWSYDASSHFLPYNSREQVFAWSDEKTAWSFASSSLVKSADGGKHWEWSSNGICGVLCGGKFHFNVLNPNLIYCGFQDNNGAISSNGGRSWKFVNLSGIKEYGHVYGGYAADENTLWACVSKEWDSDKYITVSFDGGNNCKRTGIKVSSDISANDLSSYQSLNEPDIFFAANYRSADRGKTWKKMEGCLQVYTHNPQSPHELYGCEKGGGYVVVSYDEGESWSRVNSEEIKLTGRNCLSDVAVDPLRKKLYVAANGAELFEVSMETGETVNLTGNLPRDEQGKRRVNGVAVDLSGQGRLYVAGAASTYNRRHTVIWSGDGGASWQDLGGGPDNTVSSALCIRVNPADNSLWCSTACYGMRRYGN